MAKIIYLAGGLFNAGERLHNLYVEKYLRTFGYTVILPQREALKHFQGQAFNIQGIVNSCKNSCTNPTIIYVGNIDGADADSGTCIEYGIAISATGRAIIYRTDFRTALDQEIGVNAMFNVTGTSFIYEPCFFTELDQIEQYYQGLAQKIHNSIEMIHAKKT